ncbi:MAG TPA: spermidine/putrescine ABC transporter substrate-binding protein, partial [Thermoclostridium caenicola]|nr:spermidine/putrescine ABC transporter substrate-binding protein [Thermoclostridium caenicola]
MKKILASVIVAAILISMAFSLSGCGEEQVVLNVFNWGEYIDESLLDEFEKQTGIKINYKTYD